MTREIFTPSPLYTIATAGPYPITHAYQVDSEIVCTVYQGTTIVELVNGTDFTVAPSSSKTTGDVTLSAATFATYTGASLLIRRVSVADQGWAGQTAREKGLEAQLDALTQRLQEIEEAVSRAVKLPEDTAPELPLDTAGLFLGFDAANKLYAGTTLTTTTIISPFAATLLDDPDAAAARSTLRIFNTLALLQTDTKLNTINTSPGDIIYAQDFPYQVVASGGYIQNSSASPIGLDPVRSSGQVFGAAYGISSANTAAANSAILVDINNELPKGGFIILPYDAQIDWSVASMTKKGHTIVDEDGNVIISGVGINHYGGVFSGHVVFQNVAPFPQSGGVTRVYVQPPEDIVGQTHVTDGVTTSFTAFFDAYDAHNEETLTNPDWTGPNYRDGGVSCLIGSLAPAYSPAGHVAFNAKIGGNQWPSRPSAGLSVSEKPMVTVFELAQTVALGGPTFAGGGVYPTDRWRPAKTYVAGDICHYYGRIYEVLTGGTSGTKPPLHDGIGGTRADAWDATILTTIGTLSFGFYTGTDAGTGGGTVQYALIEQVYPTTIDQVALLGPAHNVNPIIGLGDGVQLGTTMFMQENTQILSVDSNPDGSGSATGAGIYASTNGSMTYGYGIPTGLLAHHNATDRLTFNNVAAVYSEIVKPDLATTVSVSGVNIVKCNDTGATNFTGFTGAAQGQEITMTFNGSNTTLVHSSTFRLGAAAVNMTPGLNEAYKFIMREAGIAQLIG